MADPRLTGKLASFDPSPYVSGSVPVSRVVDIKIVFDYFDHDGNGHIDPKCKNIGIQNLKLAFSNLDLASQPTRIKKHIICWLILIKITVEYLSLKNLSHF